MRVAVEAKDGSVFAYRFGRLVEGHHNLHVLTGELHPMEDVLSGLTEQAKKEFPDAKRVYVQRLVSDEKNDTSEWVEVEE